MTLTPLLIFAIVIALGAFAQWLAWRLNIAAILPLLTLGFLVGPIFQIIKPGDINDDFLFPVVALLVGLILFEGGLTLRALEVRETKRIVTRLVSVGAVVTWIGCAVAAHYIAGLTWPFALLFGSLIIVTGPTVIGPLLRTVRPNQTVGSILKWEGILIDAIGALVAVLVLEFILLTQGPYAGEGFGQLGLRFLYFVVVGSVAGVIGGYFLSFVFSRRQVPHYLSNFFALAAVFLVFAISNTIASESGLLATTLMGLILANVKLPDYEHLLSFKEDLTILSISLLFIVLAANVSLETLLSALTWQNFLLVAIIMLVVRPLNVWVSTVGDQSVTNRDRLFLSWIAPRGIVAAAVTSLFVTELHHYHIEGGEQLLPLVFLVIVCTVAIGSLTAGRVARALGVAEEDPQGFLILGAHPSAQAIGQALHDEGFKVTMADRNYQTLSSARIAGLNTYFGSLLSYHSDDEIDLSGIGNLIALTPNDEANALTARKYSKIFGKDRVFQLKPSSEGNQRITIAEDQRGKLVFSDGTSFANLQQRFHAGEIKRTQITDAFTLEDFKALNSNFLPLFIIKEGKVQVVTSEDFAVSDGTLISLVVTEKETS